MKKIYLTVAVSTLLVALGSTGSAFAAASADLGDLEITMEVVGEDIESSEEITKTIELPLPLKATERNRHQVRVRNGANDAPMRDDDHKQDVMGEARDSVQSDDVREQASEARDSGDEMRGQAREARDSAEEITGQIGDSVSGSGGGGKQGGGKN